MMNWSKFRRATMGSSFSIPKGLCIKAQGCLPSEVLLTKEGKATLGKWNSEIPNPNGVVAPSRAFRSGSKRRNPFGVENLSARLPRVARCSQAWALLRNPFGIEKLAPIAARLNLRQFIICLSPAHPEARGLRLILLWVGAFARDHRKPHGVSRPADRRKQCSHPIGQQQPHHSR